MSSHGASRFSEPALQLIFAAVCLAGIVAATWLLREDFGTHRLLIHLYILSAIVLYYVFFRRTAKLQLWHSLQLSKRHVLWIVVFTGLGLVTGIIRWWFYQVTGLGGAELYEQEVIPFLSAPTVSESIGRSMGFVLLLYLAVLIPGVGFCAIIQAAFARVGFTFLGIALQALAFGWVHCFMTGSFDLTYGAEALIGAVIYGIGYAYLGNLHPPSFFLVPISL